MSGTNGVGYKDGAGNPGNCSDPSDDRDEGLGNYLGFRPGNTAQGCGTLRYFYALRDAGQTAVASAASDADGKHIYPDCRGRGESECGYASGDAVQLAMSSGKPEVCRSITNYCPIGNVTTDPPQCPGTCAVGETSIPYHPCCVPCTGTCTKSETAVPVWAPPANTKYTCESFPQTGDVTESWSSLCPFTTCPPSALKTKRRLETGTKPIDCTVAGLAACPCTGASDTRTACCTTPPPCTFLNSSGTPCVPVDPSFIPANELSCNRTPCSWTVTTTYTPPPPTCPDVVTTTYRDKYGEKDTTCDNICTGWNAWSAWGNCLMAAGGAHKQSRTRTMRCNNPCPSSELYCPHEAENRTCDLCDDGRTVALAEGQCTATVPPPGSRLTFHVSTSAIDHTNVGCNCVETTDITPEPPDECTTYEKLSEAPCEANIKHVWYDFPYCHCLCRNEETRRDHCESTADLRAGTWKTFPACYCQPSSGTHSVKICISHALLSGMNSGTRSIIRSILYPDNPDTLIDVLSMSVGARGWGSVLAKLRCGAPGATYRANHASAETLNHLINSQTALDRSGRKMNVGPDCSVDPIKVTWDCS